MAIMFLFLIVLAQAAFLLVARQTAAAAVGAAAREAARPGASLVDERRELVGDIMATVPGAMNPRAEVTIEGRNARASVAFDWRPPGPDFVPITMTVDAESPLVVLP